MGWWGTGRAAYTDGSMSVVAATASTQRRTRSSVRPHCIAKQIISWRVRFWGLQKSDFCWECYSCVKACPQNAIDVRGYADFAPLGHSVRVQRDEEKGTIAWKIKFRNGTEKNFLSPITTKPWGTAIWRHGRGCRSRLRTPWPRCRLPSFGRSSRKSVKFSGRTSDDGTMSSESGRSAAW